MTGHLKDNLFVLTALQGGLRGGVGALFWAKKWPENQFFLRYFHITRLFWSQTDLTQRNHNIPYPEVTLDTFGRCPFGCSAGRCMAPIAENYHFWARNAYYSIISHGIVWYCMELNCILWYCIVSYGIELYLMVLHWYCMVFHCIAWYCMVLQDVALYCTVSHCIILNLTILHGIALYHCWLRRAGCISQDTYIYFI